MSLLSRYYDFDLIGELPLGDLPGLLKYAERQEAEKQLFPLWLVYYAGQSYKGEEALSFEELLGKIDPAEAAQDGRSPEEILADFAPIVAADRHRKEG